jgi:hypothetical protein
LVVGNAFATALQGTYKYVVMVAIGRLNAAKSDSDKSGFFSLTASTHPPPLKSLLACDFRLFLKRFLFDMAARLSS